MLFAGNSNRRMSASLMDEIMGSDEQEDLNPHSSYQDVIKELEKLDIDFGNVTIAEILQIISKKITQVFEMCKSADPNYPFRRYEITPENQHLHIIKTHVQEVAIWLYDGERAAMPADLKKYMLI